MVTRSAKLKCLLEIPSHFDSWCLCSFFLTLLPSAVSAVLFLDLSNLMTLVFSHLSLAYFSRHCLRLIFSGGKDRLGLPINISIVSCHILIIHFRNYFFTFCLLHILNSSRVEGMPVSTVSQLHG